MSEPAFVPDEFEGLVDLAAEGLGGFALYATDDFFAEKENLLRKPEAVFIEGKYTDKGKWMDGWESQRRRTPGHDFCIIRLGLPGAIGGIVVDTTHFKGNAPAEISFEAIEAPSSSLPLLMRDEGWSELIPRARVKPDFRNVFSLGDTRRFTHVKLRIFPDGGVARLRVFGTVRPEPRTFWRPGSLDLVAVENGGTVAKASNKFFGPPANLLLPGRGVNMGDGWETARRRTPGSDWCVLKLGRPGIIERIELDTHFFKGNAPQAVLLEAVDARGMSDAQLAKLLEGGPGWHELLGRTPTEQHKRHQLDPDRRMIATHVRAHIFPHGGVNRLRLFGTPLDDDRTSARLAVLNGLASDAAREVFLSFNGSRRLAEALDARRPFGAARDLFALAEKLWWELGEEDRLEAFAAHPRIGEKKAAASATAQSATWSAGEQSGAAHAEARVAAQLAELNELYLRRFGFIYIVCATGRSAPELLALLEERLENERAAELENAAREQARITRLRIEKWLLA
jgi:allantoicase